MTDSMRLRPRFQFSIRLMLLVMAIVAAAFGVATYFYEPPIRPITDEQSQRITPGMSRRQVISILGSPLRGPNPNPPKWIFHFSEDSVHSNYSRALEVWFDGEGKVKEVRVRRYMMF